MVVPADFDLFAAAVFELPLISACQQHRRWSLISGRNARVTAKAVSATDRTFDSLRSDKWLTYSTIQFQ
jgi:hypothetical protein